MVTSRSLMTLAPARSLFPSLIRGSDGFHPRLGKERIAKILKQSLATYGSIYTHGKFARSIASTHVFNLGVAESRILRQGRWARASTFHSHYKRARALVEHDPNRFKSVSIAEALRVRVSDP